MKTRSTSILVATLLLAACARKPVTAPRAVIPETTADLRVAATPAKRFGHMVALGVGLSSGLPGSYVVTADRIFAVDRDGNRVAPLAVSEAARQAGGATALIAGLQGAGGGALLTGLLGAVPGAILGAASGGASGAGKGAAVGAGIGIAVGAIAGFYESKTKTEREIISQLGDLYLGAKTSKPGLPVSGFVFLPRGDYVGIDVIAVEEPGGAVHEVYGPMVAQPSG